MTSHLTPVNKLFPTCERTCAELRLYPKEATAQELTTFLGVSPSFCASKGDNIHKKNGVRIAKNSFWILTSENDVESLDLRDHLDWILKQILPARKRVLELQRLQNCKMTIFCIWWSAHGGSGPVIWPEQMESMCKLNLECSFDFNYYGEMD